MGDISVPSDVNRATGLTDRPQGQYDSGDMGKDRFKLPGNITITIIRIHIVPRLY